MSLVMHEGIGVFNFGMGELGSIRCGKSQLINDVIYPVSSQKSFVYVNEQNIMSIGTVDVLFENMCDYKRNIVLMDGQGAQDMSVLKKCIKMSNALVVHVDYHEVKSKSKQKIEDGFEMLRQMKEQQKDLKVFIIVRDSNKMEMIKKYGQE